ncbi:divalent cation transporter [Limibaculum sp. FT325]|uniref:ZIP family metal transporter n=1 Tax=Thermohalobaculum sediminis TaxID=2939436 RepID=UPI0020C04727|nr:divalent cation transporter [Limibaculum sediminis]MCL5776457.1 divalent cation transporter [Limibaculum sediminis]
MDEIARAILYGLLVGLTIPLGGALGRIPGFQRKWLEQEVRHSVIAFGGGVLVAAVALVLVPEAMEVLPLWLALAAFGGGGLLFAAIERGHRGRGGSHAQFIAMLADFLPEALALGAFLATGSPEVGLLAVLIAVQNLPEAFNAWRELRADGRLSARRIMVLFFCLAALGPVAVLAGLLLLSGLPVVTGAIMMAAAGGILFLMFQDIAVQAHLRNAQAPSLAALGGFAVGIVGQALTG